MSLCFIVVGRCSHCVQLFTRSSPVFVLPQFYSILIALQHCTQPCSACLMLTAQTLIIRELSSMRLFQYYRQSAISWRLLIFFSLCQFIYLPFVVACCFVHSLCYFFFSFLLVSLWLNSFFLQCVTFFSFCFIYLFVFFVDMCLCVSFVYTMILFCVFVV